jgi:predicted RNA-binding Zn ribbon-like protein
MTDTSARDLIAGHPALDFTNTVGWHAGPDGVEKFHSYGDLLDWARAAGVVSRSQLTLLRRRADGSPQLARSALRRAIAIRELLYRIFTALVHGTPPAPRDLRALHTVRLAALRQARPGWDGALAVSFARSDDLLAPVWPLVLAAVDLLRSPERDRVRQCANDPCGWLFVDRSKNRSRRWCSSGDCGNETRVRRFREKAKEL